MSAAAATEHDGAGTVPAPAPQALADVRNLTWEALGEVAALVESYARSLGESAWRGDPETSEVHIRQLRACVLEAARLFRGQFPKTEGDGQ
jgi:hypothetical protein